MSATGWEGILHEDEQILWQGRPRGDLAFIRRTAFEEGFGIFWLAFSVFWMVGASSASILFGMFGLPFVAIGIYMTAGHHFWHAYRRRHTWYTLTNERAFIATDIMGRRNLTSHAITPQSQLELETLPMAQNLWFATETKHSKNGTYTVPIGFEFLDDAADVMRLMRDIQRGTT